MASLGSRGASWPRRRRGALGPDPGSSAPGSWPPRGWAQGLGGVGGARDLGKILHLSGGSYQLLGHQSVTGGAILYLIGSYQCQFELVRSGLCRCTGNPPRVLGVNRLIPGNRKGPARTGKVSEMGAKLDLASECA